MHSKSAEIRECRILGKFDWIHTVLRLKCKIFTLEVLFKVIYSQLDLKFTLCIQKSSYWFMVQPFRSIGEKMRQILAYFLALDGTESQNGTGWHGPPSFQSVGLVVGKSGYKGFLALHSTFWNICDCLPQNRQKWQFSRILKYVKIRADLVWNSHRYTNSHSSGPSISILTIRIDQSHCWAQWFDILR